MRTKLALLAGLLLALGAFAPNAFAGTARTQTYVHVFVDCVAQGSGTYDATFGYTNDNSTPQTVVVGSDNYFTPPPIDRGQTTVFQPGTVHNAFTVSGIPSSTKLTWTVSLNGHTESVNVSASSSHACNANPAPAIRPAVDCVTKNADNTFDATFAYTNEGSSAQTVPVGTNNYFSPPPIDRGQTTVFQPGTVHNAFTVKGIPASTKLTWTVNSRSTTADTSDRACAPVSTAKPIHVAVDCVTKNATTFDATFAYDNQNAVAETIVVGSDNYLSPPPIDRGQTTSFQPGPHHGAFTVTGIPNGTKLKWTLAFGGSTDSATASTSSPSCAPATKPIHVAVDCVTKNATTFDATFAYDNQNAVPETIAVGSENYFSPPPIDRGQTTSFQPGPHHGAFTVTGIPNGTKLKWTLAFGGSTDSATASTSSPTCRSASTGVIHVYVDCVTKGSTTYDATFAYANDNAAAQTVPTGSDNFFTPPPIDRGQTTTFQPGLHHAAFVVTGIPLTTKLGWTVAFGGSTRTATASSSSPSCQPRVKKLDVFVQCVTRNANGFDATFGYENDNSTAQTVPVGGDNYFSPPPSDRGQTTTFQPGKVQSAFTVTGIPYGTRLTWTVNSGGRSDSATATGSSRRCVSNTPPAKVTICHRTNGKRQWVPVTVPARTAAWLLRHGDVMPDSNGKCPAPKHHKKNWKNGNGSSNGNQQRQDKRHR